MRQNKFYIVRLILLAVVSLLCIGAVYVDSWDVDNHYNRGFSGDTFIKISVIVLIPYLITCSFSFMRSKLGAFLFWSSLSLTSLWGLFLNILYWLD